MGQFYFGDNVDKWVNFKLALTMAGKNIHGHWDMTFENRILLSKSIGATDAEASVAFLKELQELVLSSPEGVTTPWVAISDSRNWGGLSLDAGEATDKITEWVQKNNCIFSAVVMSKKLQKFTTDTALSNQTFTVFFDDDEAYQACKEKLLQANKTHEA